MTCQHCQTWILDDDHRCRRCGRRIRSTPSRISPSTYPIAAAATAPAYEFEALAASQQAGRSAETAAPVGAGQQALFAAPASEARLISFDSLTSPAEREAIRIRAAQTQRPTPLRNTRVEAKRARVKRNETPEQRRLELGDQADMATQRRLDVICNARVASAAIRVQAALLDALLMGCGCGLSVAVFLGVGGRLTEDRHLLPFVTAALLTVPLLYKLLWAFAGQDSPGTRLAGLKLVDFDGRKPSKERRYQRLFGSVLSLLAAGIGMVWALVDEDKLTWHDHMSGTFPTFSSKS